jgi:hypothetical protein
MRALLPHLDATSRALSLFLGSASIVLAVAVAVSSRPVAAIGTWAIDVLSVSFVTIFIVLTYTAIFCLVRIWRDEGPAGIGVWYEAGISCANGIATLALNHTLLGIALGVGQLAEKDLNPGTVQGIIRGLTADFSMAFMTTLVGLPASALLRAALSVLRAWKAHPHRASPAS